MPEQTFQTSFIPKAPLKTEAPRRRGGLGLLGLVATIIILASLISAGAVYFLRSSLKKSVADSQRSLALAEEEFNRELVEDIQKLDRRFEASYLILDRHITLSPVFEKLQELVLPAVRFTSFEYSMDETGGTTLNIAMTGTAKDYRSIALQSDLLGSERHIVNPIFSDLALDDFGNVGFSLSFSVNQALVLYVNQETSGL